MVGCCSSCMPLFCSFSVFFSVLKCESVNVCHAILIWCMLNPNLMATTEQILKSDLGTDLTENKTKTSKFKMSPLTEGCVQYIPTPLGWVQRGFLQCC